LLAQAWCLVAGTSRAEQQTLRESRLA